MENNYQEKIMEEVLKNLVGESGFSEYIVETIRDCFAITRIQNEISSLSQYAAFNNAPRRKMEEKYEELDKILSKYPNAVKATK